METIVDLTNLSKSFMGTSVIEDVEMKVTAGKIVGLVGANGSGKSVLLKIIAGFITPDSGEILVLGELRKRYSKTFDSRIGIVIDKPAFNPGKTGFENLSDLASINKVIGETQVGTIMQTMGLERDNRTNVKSYSLGMKQKLAIAQAIMENQQLILLDEPFNGLDVTSVGNLRTLIKKLSGEGKTIIFTSHIQEDIDSLADEVYHIENNKLIKKEVKNG
jgi:ABC-2 type transport system ATP-binding protein